MHDPIHQSSILPSIPYISRIFPALSRLLPCLNQPGLEQRREAVLFKTVRLTDFHLAEPGRRWSDVVRHAGAIRKDGTHVGSHSGTDSRPGFFQTSRRGYLVSYPFTYNQNIVVVMQTHSLTRIIICMNTLGEQYYDENRVQELPLWSQNGSTICSKTWCIPKTVRQLLFLTLIACFCVVP